LQSDTIDINSIIAGCRKGNRKAQEQLYRAYYGAMVSLCLRYTKNNDDAVEVLNNGFLKVFQNIERYNPQQAGLYAWIRTIIINSCLDFIRQKTRALAGVEMELAADVHIAADVVQKINADELLTLVRQLAPATQGVFNLYVIEGYSHKEIAQLLSISEGTSKWHLAAARKQLQHLLQKDKNLHG